MGGRREGERVGTTDERAGERARNLGAPSFPGGPSEKRQRVREVSAGGAGRGSGARPESARTTDDVSGEKNEEDSCQFFPGAVMERTDDLCGWGFGRFGTFGSSHQALYSVAHPDRRFQ